MGWKIEFSDEALRELSNLDRKTAQQITKRIDEAAEDPYHYFSRLTGQDDYKLRAGDYRVVVLLLHSRQTVFIEKIGHRKNVYKR